MKLIQHYLNRLLGRESIFTFSLLDQSVKLAISTRREIRRVKELSIEQELIERIRHHLQKDDVIYDVGANIGLISILTAQAPEGTACRVFSFEPEPKNFEQLKKNVTLNQLEERVSTHQLALAGSTGEVDLHVRGSAGEGRHSIASKKGSTDTISVGAMTMADFADRNSYPNLVKIDVEGAEGQVLAGMLQLLEHHSPREIFLEIHPKGDGDLMPDGTKIHLWLEQNGYKLLWQNQRGSGEHRHYQYTGHQDKQL